MKKRSLLRLISLGLIMSLLSLFTVGCTKTGETDSANQDSSNQNEQLRIGIVIMATQGSEYQLSLGEAAKKAAERYGAEATVFGPKTYGDYSQQINIMEDLITKKVDLIIISPAHEDALIPAIQKAWDAGIPVVSYCTSITEPLALCEIYIADENIGYESAKYLFEKLGGKGKVIQLEGEAGNPAANARKKGVDRALKEYPGIELVASQNAHWTIDGGLEVTENALLVNPDIAGVCAANDDAALGAIQALQNKNSQALVASIDGTKLGLQAVKDGSMLVTIRQRVDAMGDLAVRYGLAYVKYFKDIDSDALPTEGYKGLPKPFMQKIDAGVDIVDKSNVDDYL